LVSRPTTKIHHEAKISRQQPTSTMRLPRRPLRVFYPRTQFMIKDKKPPALKQRTAEDDERPKKKKVNHVQPPRKVRVREGEADPKLAGAILELVQGTSVYSFAFNTFRSWCSSDTEGVYCVAFGLCESSVQWSYGCTVRLPVFPWRLIGEGNSHN
jgi:hypothetical protein